MKLCGTVVIFGLLTSGISSNYVFGMEVPLESTPLLSQSRKKTPSHKSKAEKKSHNSKEEEKFTLGQKVGLGLLMLIMATSCGLWIFGSTISPSSHPSKILHPSSFLPINSNTSIPCSHDFPLNGEFNCSSPEETYRLGACLAEAVYSGDCIEECTDQAGRLVAPKRFVCEANSSDLQLLLKQLERENVPYYHSGNSTVGGKKIRSYTYESKHFKWPRPKKHFTVGEIENDPEAMAVLDAYFKFTHSQNENPCDEFRLVEE